MVYSDYIYISIELVNYNVIPNMVNEPWYFILLIFYLFYFLFFYFIDILLLYTIMV